MAEDRNEEQVGEQSETGQEKQSQTTGQQGQQSELGQQGQSSSDQTDLGQDGDTATLRDEQRGTGGSQDTGGTGGPQGGSGGFVGSQGSGSSDYLQEDSSRESDFASQGQGALEGQNADIETGQPHDSDNDIEGGTGS